jgi:hypothetical protein
VPADNPVPSTSDPYSNLLSSDAAATDATPASSSSSSVMPAATDADSTTTAPKTSDPAQVALPDEDEAEQAWHKAALIVEGDIRERVTIPAEFAEKCMWSHPLSYRLQLWALTLSAM